MLRYSVTLTPDDNGTLLATCEALPEVTSFGEDRDDALRHVGEAVEEALAARIAGGGDVPLGTAEGADVIAVPLLPTLKVLLYISCRNGQVSRAELARRLGWHREQVDRLFRLDHASRSDQIEAAFAALDQQIDVRIRSAA